ncbi:MAG: ATPase, T2SS/T4P/T4SS family [Candidatus Altiarchaeota archaeon]|nr:ATPase, T2SS/T4P/T4SS family [Candidatus Altiarchaeota archaeon]
MKELEKYQIKAEDIILDVVITEDKNEKRYNLCYPEFLPATKAVLEFIIDKVGSSESEKVHVEGEMGEVKSIKRIFKNAIDEYIRKELILVDEETRRFLLTDISFKALGYGRIEYLLKDPNLEEIKVNTAKKPVSVSHKYHGWMDTNINMDGEEEIRRYAERMGREVGREINMSKPILEATLPTGDRVEALLMPISAQGNTITIRMFARTPWVFTKFIETGTVTSEVLALIWEAIQYEQNVLIAGGTASGKTSFLNTLMPFIPSNQIILSIEDTRELQLPDFLRWQPRLATSIKEGVGISMYDLLKAAVRERPDRIVFGEIRRENEAKDLLEAMHTGHSAYSTIHADSISETIHRLTGELRIDATMLTEINLVCVLQRDRWSQRRRVTQVGEIIIEGEIPLVNLLYVWDAKNDRIVANNEPKEFYDKIIKRSGKTREEIVKEMSEKKEIIDWIVRRKIKDVNEVGGIINDYYMQPQEVLEAAKKDGGV